MSNLPESPTWEEGIYQLELTDPVEGGPEGIDNLQAKQLANRTAWLKQQVEQAGTDLAAHESDPDPHPQYLTQPEGDSRYAQGDHSHGNATTSAAGFMSASDKSKLDGMASGAAAVGSTAGAALAAAGSAGVAGTAARSDHVHPYPTAAQVGAAATSHTHAVGDVSGAAPLASPALTGTPTAPTATAGTSTTQIATTAFVANAVAGAGGTTLGNTAGAALAGSGSAGSAATAARSDHVHPYPTAANVGAMATSHAANSITGFGSSSSSLAASQSAGSASTVSRSDHVHPFPTAAQVGAAASSHTHAVGDVSGAVPLNGALGTPSSGNVGNCTVDGTNGVGFRNIPQVSQAGAYTCVLSDAGKHIYETGAGTVTIPANASVAYPIGTAITLVSGASAISIAITTDTLRLAGAGTTGTRTLAAYGMATAVKVAPTEWRISGTGLS